MPIVLFMAGLARVGPSTASIASTIEPPFTVALAWIVFGETLGPLQLAGGAFVLSAVVLLQLRSAASSPRSVSPESPLARTSLRQSSSVPPEASQDQVSATVSATRPRREPGRGGARARHPVEAGERGDRPQRQRVPRLLDLLLDPPRVGPAQLAPRRR